MNVVHSFVIWRGVWYSPLHLVSSSSRSWENVMQVVPSEGDIRFSPVQTDIFRWVQKTGSSQLICALCTPAEFLCCQQTHKIEKTSSLFCKVHRLCKINWRRVTPPTNYFIMGKHWLQYIYCYNNYYYIILYYIILYYIAFTWNASSYEFQKRHDFHSSTTCNDQVSDLLQRTPEDADIQQAAYRATWPVWQPDS